MIRRLAAVAFVTVAILASAWPLLSGERFAFRDASHFYLPVYDYVAQRTAEQWLPFWNPLDHTGIPLIGESSTGVLYPIRYAIFSLPISSESALNGFLLFHLLLASATSAWLAARIGCDRIGVMTAAIVYPLSGSVFSLCCNPPFLVGAAWIPLALGACLADQRQGDGPTRRSSARRVAIAAVALAMMVLGGDPQSALHCVLVVCAVAAVAAIVRVSIAKESIRAIGGKQLVRSVLICLSASILAIGLSAIQIAASFDWSRQSDRVAEIERRTDLYNFSLAPWHSLELISPRPFGHLFPINQRIARLIPGEGRMWTPSIYAGFIVGFALFCRLLKPRSYFTEPWFPIAMACLLLCFGHFGLVWVIQQLPGVLSDKNSAIGGPYWVICHLVPGYSSFRYPIKWLPLFAIASSMVTAQWLTAVPAKHERRLAVVLAVLFIGIGWGSHWVSQNWSTLHLHSRWAVPVDEYWGPLDVAGGFAWSRVSCLWSLLALMVLAGFRSVSLYQKGASLPSWAVGGWILFVSVDCVLSASTLLPAVNIETERKLAHQASPSPIPATRTLRTQAGIWPTRWRSSHSPDRALEVAASERMAWFGRWHLAERRAVFNSMVSIRSRSYSEFWRSSNRQLGQLDREERIRFWDSVRRWLAIDAVSHVDESRVIAAGGHSLVYVDRWLTEPTPKFRVFTKWMPEKPMSEIISALGRSDDVPLPHVAVDSPTPVTGSGANWEQASDGTIRLSCNADCLLERSVYQDGNWTATIESQSGEGVVAVPVHRSSHLKQAVRIPVGVWTVQFVYRPWWKWPAILVMSLSLIVLVILPVLPNPSSR